MRIPISIDQIEFDAAAQRFAAIHSNSGIAKIGSGFTVPGAELDDVDLVARRAHKSFAKFAGEPAGLELEFIRRAQRKKKRAFLHAAARAHLSVTLCAGGHAPIMKSDQENVTRELKIRHLSFVIRHFILPPCSTFVSFAKSRISFANGSRPAAARTRRRSTSY